MSGFWDGLGTDEAGMPVHLPMGVNAAGQGPVSDAEAHHWVCWCADPACPLTAVLRDAGLTQQRARVARAEQGLRDFLDWCDEARDNYAYFAMIRPDLARRLRDVLDTSRTLGRG